MNATTSAAAEVATPETNWVLRIANTSSTWKVILRRVAIVKRVVESMMDVWRRKKDSGGQGTAEGVVSVKSAFPLDLKAIDDAEKLIWRATQRKSYGDEAARKKLAALNPFEAEDGLLRCGGRLARAAGLDFDARCPIILPSDSKEVRALLTSIHEDFLHAGVDQVLGESRRRYWIVKGRRTTAGVIRACVGCQKLFKKPQAQ